MGLKRWDDFNKVWSDPEEAGSLKATGANPNLIVNDGYKDKQTEIAPSLSAGETQGHYNIIVNQPKEKKEPTGNQQNLVVVTGNNKKTQKLKEKKLASAIKSSNQTNPRSGGNILVSGPTTMTNTPAKSIEKDSVVTYNPKLKNMKPSELAPSLLGSHYKEPPIVRIGTNPQGSTKGTSGQLTLLSYQNTTSSVRDFLANLSVLLGSEEDLKILEAHSSLRLCESLGLKEPRIYYLRMSKDSSRMMKGIHSKQSSERWMNLGMTVNGRCLTAIISESSRTEKGCSLSDILEDNPDPKYFLSEKQTKYIQNQMDKSPTPLTAIITKDG